jgi:tRNA(Ile)-lysidine synthase
MESWCDSPTRLSGQLMAHPWSPFHLRLHRLLRQRPELLPETATLLLAVSGGQDSMALTGLLLDLRRLHGWSLQLWHGDHGWRKDSTRQAQELAAWAESQGLAITVERWERDGPPTEAEGREWRYSCLSRVARQQGIAQVLTGHTASDRAETLLLNLARGSHRRGLASLPLERDLAPGIALVRPLLGFSRADTAAVCEQCGLPVWQDPSNADPRFSRNRVRHELMPVLEALHPGAARRLAATAERLAAEDQAEAGLLALALESLQVGAAAAGSAGSQALRRRELVAQAAANQSRLLQHWISRRRGVGLNARQLELLRQRLAWGRPPGAMDLADGWQLRWDRSTVVLQQP